MLQSDVIQQIVAINTAAQGRVHHQVIPQRTALPFVAVQRISGNQPLTLTGTRLLERATLRVAIFATSYQTAELIERDIRTTFHGYRGTLGSTTIHSTSVQSTSDEVSFVDGDDVIKGTGIDLSFVYQE